MLLVIVAVLQLAVLVWSAIEHATAEQHRKSLLIQLHKNRILQLEHQEALTEIKRQVTLANAEPKSRKRNKGT